MDLIGTPFWWGDHARRRRKIVPQPTHVHWSYENMQCPESGLDSKSKHTTIHSNAHTPIQTHTHTETNIQTHNKCTVIHARPQKRIHTLRQINKPFTCNTTTPHSVSLTISPSPESLHTLLEDIIKSGCDLSVVTSYKHYKVSHVQRPIQYILHIHNSYYQIFELNLQTHSETIPHSNTRAYTHGHTRTSTLRYTSWMGLRKHTAHSFDVTHTFPLTNIFAFLSFVLCLNVNSLICC